MHDYQGIFNLFQILCLPALQCLVSLNEDSNDHGVGDQVDDVEQDGKKQLSGCAGSDINKSKGYSRVVPTCKVLEKELIYLLLTIY